jgi:hypothetical protein
MADKEPDKTREKAAAPRRNGIARLSSELPALTRTVFKNSAGGRGFAEAGLITEWAAIVGAGIAAMSQPATLVFPRGERKGGVLTIRCGGAAALELQHLKPQILDRINSHFGYAAIRDIRFQQGDLRTTARSARRRDSAAPSPKDIAAVDATLTAVPDGALRETLQRLGVAIRGGAGRK